MARRSIARTAIEGGRAKHNRLAEEREDRRCRHAYRAFCRRARLDPELDEPTGWEDTEYNTGRQYRDFPDKLSPVRRWLESRVGRPWDEVYSEIARTFDRRSLAGRHVLGHLETMVTLYGRLGIEDWRRRVYLFPGDLFTDARGILCQAPIARRRAFWGFEWEHAVAKVVLADAP